MYVHVGKVHVHVRMADTSTLSAHNAVTEGSIIM